MASQKEYSCSLAFRSWLLPAAADLMLDFLFLQTCKCLTCCHLQSNGSLVKTACFTEVLSSPGCSLYRATFILNNIFVAYFLICLSFHFDTTFHIWIEETKVIYLLSCFDMFEHTKLTIKSTGETIRLPLALT